MAHITLKNDQLPGIAGLLDYRPETAKPLRELAEALLREPSTLTSAERELIASSVSDWNQCRFCHSAHGAAAAAYLRTGTGLLEDIKAGLKQTQVSAKLRALLYIARLVTRGGRHVTEMAIKAARDQGATDCEIHDTVLIAAAFCMYNRYVDGLGTWAPDTDEAYLELGQRLATTGYMDSPAPKRAG